jgi:hypothetical protein
MSHGAYRSQDVCFDPDRNRLAEFPKAPLKGRKETFPVKFKTPDRSPIEAIKKPQQGMGGLVLGLLIIGTKTHPVTVNATIEW